MHELLKEYQEYQEYHLVIICPHRVGKTAMNGPFDKATSGSVAMIQNTYTHSQL
jgi:hypothetical protein